MHLITILKWYQGVYGDLSNLKTIDVLKKHEVVFHKKDRSKIIIPFVKMAMDINIEKDAEDVSYSQAEIEQVIKALD